MPVAANIDEVIAFTATDVGEVSYGGVKSLFTQMNLWAVGVFGSSPTTGIFPPNQNDQHSPGQRPVTDWFAATKMAISAIEGPLVNQAGVVGTAAVIDAVVRTAYAVKYARVAGLISAAQQTAVVTLYNTVWA